MTQFKKYLRESLKESIEASISSINRTIDDDFWQQQRIKEMCKLIEERIRYWEDERQRRTEEFIDAEERYRKGCEHGPNPNDSKLDRLMYCIIHCCQHGPSAECSEACIGQCMNIGADDECDALRQAMFDALDAVNWSYDRLRDVREQYDADCAMSVPLKSTQQKPVGKIPSAGITPVVSKSK
jgi:hypothetical protein